MSYSINNTMSIDSDPFALSCVVNVDISDDTGRAVAQFTGLGFKLH